MLCVRCLTEGRSAVTHDKWGDPARNAARSAITISEGDALCVTHLKLK